MYRFQFQCLTLAFTYLAKSCKARMSHNLNELSFLVLLCSLARLQNYSRLSLP